MSGKYHRTRNGLTKRDFTFENPFDLAPVYAAYAQAIEEEFSQLEPGQILVILSGETHNDPLDVLSHIGPMDYLHRKYLDHGKSPDRRFLVAHEAESNLIVNLADYYNIHVPGYLRDHPEQLDPDNHLALDILSSTPISIDAPCAHSIFYSFLKRKSIPVLFNDAARFHGSDGMYIHTHTRSFRQTCREYFGINRVLYKWNDINRLYNIKVDHRLAMGIRNLTMVKKALKQARLTGARIIFQHCGQGHILDEYGNGSLRNALAFLYRKAGARVLPSLSHMSPAEPDYFEEFPHAFIREGLDRRSFRNPIPEYNQSEISYIARLEKSYSGADCPFSVNDVPTPITAEEIRQRLRQNIERNRRTIFHQQMPALKF